MCLAHVNLTVRIAHTRAMALTNFSQSAETENDPNAPPHLCRRIPL